MKDERSRRLYDGITNVDEDLVEEVLAKEPSRPRYRLRWAVAAACLCLVVGGLALWSSRGTVVPAPNPGNATNSPIEGNITDKPGEASEPVMGPDGADIHSVEIVPMIDCFGESTYSADMTVVNGGCVFSDSLEAALQEYGDTVRYRVMIEFFRDGVQIDSGDEIALGECDRLADAGYITALETYNDGSAEHHYFTIHATAEQLRNYPLDKELGYSFLLYGEYFGKTFADNSTVFNGEDSLP